MVLGLTGKYCTGKNYICKIFEEAGFAAIDVDRLGHQAHQVPEIRDRIREVFGPTAIGADGNVDRKALGTIVFTDPGRLAALEGIVHPWMVEKTGQLIGEYGDRVIVNAAILFKMKLHTLCSGVVWVDAPLLERIRRGMNRDNLPFGAVLRRIWAQRSLTPQPFRDSVDIYTVRNSGKGEDLRLQVARILEGSARPL